MRKLVFIFMLAIFSNPSMSKDTIWRDNDDKSLSPLKITIPTVGDKSLFVSSLKLYVDVYDAKFGQPKIPLDPTAPLNFLLGRSNGFLGTVEFDEDKGEKERTIHLEPGKSYFFHAVFQQIAGSTQYTCNVINKTTPVIAANTDYVLYADFRRLGIMSVRCNAQLFTTAEFELQRSVNKENTGIGELSRLELSIIYGSAWVALTASQRIVIDHDYEARYVDAAANRLQRNFKTTDIYEVKTLNYMARIIEETGSKKYKLFLQSLLKSVESDGNKKLSSPIKSALKKSSGESDSIFEASTIKTIEGYTLDDLQMAALNETIANGTGLELQGAGMQLTHDTQVFGVSTLDLAAEKLWVIYSINDDLYINAARWLSRGLSKSNYSRYKTLFEKIMQKPIHAKLLKELQDLTKENIYVETEQFNPEKPPIQPAQDKIL